MVAVKNIVAFATGALAFVVRRDFNTVVSDLDNIDSQIKSLGSAAAAYTGGVAAALTIQNDEQNLEKAIKSATTDAQNAGSVDDAQAQQVIDYINNTLEPDTANTVTDIINKKSQFASAGLTSTVQTDFSNLKKLTTSYGSALLADAPSDKQSAGQTALNNVIAQLNRGAAAFSS